MENFKKTFWGGYEKEGVQSFIKGLEEEKKSLIEQAEKEKEKLLEKEEEISSLREEKQRLLEKKEEEKEKIKRELEDLKEQFARLLEENEKLSAKIKSSELSNDFLRRQLLRHEIELPKGLKEDKEEEKDSLDEEIENFNRLLKEGSSLKEEEGCVCFPEKKRVRQGEDQDRKNNRYVKMLKKMIDF